jgi:hypothetical protein
MFTWSLESVIVSLFGMFFVSNYLFYSFFVISCITIVLMLFSVSLKLDKEYVIAVSHLCSISGGFLIFVLKPLNDINNVVSFSIMCVLQLIAFGITFASNNERSSLFLEMRGHYCIVVPLILEVFLCIDILDYKDMAFASALIYVMFQFSPIDAIALLAACCFDFLFVIIFAAFSKYTQALIMFIKLMISTIWFLRCLVNALFPDFVKVNPDLSVKIGTIDGPWLESIFLILLSIGFVCIIVLQENYIVIFPLVLCILWLVFHWLMQSTNIETSTTNTLPTQNQNASNNLSMPVQSHLISQRNYLPWPRMRVPKTRKEI